MKYNQNITLSAGAFAVVNQRSKLAYVGYCKSLRRRAIMWRYWFKKKRNDPTYTFPISGVDGITGWVFIDYPDLSADVVRAQAKKDGYRVINSKSRKRALYSVDAHVHLPLTKLATLHKENYQNVYRRLQKGFTLRQALGLDPSPPDLVYDPREHKVKMMRVKILGKSGGYLSYDEALLERPELGDIRARVAALRKQRPNVTEIKLENL